MGYHAHTSQLQPYCKQDPLLPDSRESRVGEYKQWHPDPIRRAYLKLSLVSASIATSSSEKVSFNRLNRKTGNRIKLQNVDAVTAEAGGCLACTMPRTRRHPSTDPPAGAMIYKPM